MAKHDKIRMTLFKRNFVYMSNSKHHGYHINWTAPTFSGASYSSPKLGKNGYEIDELEILTTVLSIASWQKWHGSIGLYCDTIAANYYDSIGLLSLWDSIDTDLLDALPHHYASQQYFAFAKLWVQNKLDPPFTILDTDAYLVRDISSLLNDNSDVIVSHQDSLKKEAPYAVSYQGKLSYPSLDKVILNQKFTLPSYFKDEAHGLNVAFLMIKSPELKTEYIRLALDYIDTHVNATFSEEISFAAPIVFAEQRLLGGLVAGVGYKCKYLREDLHMSINCKQILTKDIWINQKTNQPYPANLETIIPIHINALRHLWVSKSLLPLSNSFRLLAISTLYEDMLEICPEHLGLPIIKSIFDRYTPIENKKTLIDNITSDLLRARIDLNDSALT